MGGSKSSEVWTVSEKQTIGNLLSARKITGMLLGSSRSVAMECAASERVLRARIEQCQALLVSKGGVNGAHEADA